MGLFGKTEIKELAGLKAVATQLSELLPEWDGQAESLKEQFEALTESAARAAYEQAQNEAADSLNGIVADAVAQAVDKAKAEHEAELQAAKEITDEQVSEAARAMLAESGHTVTPNASESTSVSAGNILEEMQSISNPVERAAFRAKHEKEIMDFITANRKI